MSRTRGTYSTLDNWVLDLAPTLPGAAGWVLLKLAAQINYKRKTMTMGQLMDALAYDIRTLSKACAFLVQEGYILCTNGEHVLCGACTPFAQDVNKARTSPVNEKASQTTETVTHSEIAEHNKKEVEGREEKELKDKNTPLTPQGVAEPEEQGETASAQNAAADLQPVQDSSLALQEPSPAKDVEKVPRRRATSSATLPDDLATLPGMTQAWAKWTKYAREVRLNLTESVADAQFSKLRKLHDEGWDLPHIVQHAIENSWKSFFAIRGEQPRQNLKFSPPPTETDLPARRSYE